MELKFWEEYPTISKIDGEEVVLDRPSHKELIDTLKYLKEDEYLVLYDYKILPRGFYYSYDFMKHGPDLKIKKVDSNPLRVFPNELKKYDPYRPKRGFKWTNPNMEVSIFVSISSLIDGAKLYAVEKENIKVGGRGRRAWIKVPSRQDGEHKVFLDPMPQPNGRNWYEFYGDCDCGEHMFYKHGTKYKNPEDYVCPHIIAGYHRAMGAFPEMGENHLPPLFPAPSKDMLLFDESLAKAFVKDKYRRRINKGEREVLLSRYQGYYKDGLTFSLKGVYDVYDL